MDVSLSPALLHITIGAAADFITVLAKGRCNSGAMLILNLTSDPLEGVILFTLQERDKIRVKEKRDKGEEAKTDKAMRRKERKMNKKT